eukprot:TRINITY_DN4213_c0_g1_i3.p3 TRINITY_DN4213_c0_g1~~TRINITY_DN4213_c0_g1_i3.p3  ORF type:complete len:125 (+),score=16.88 TRINITY_DN4213_c0_g1_i3:179-553(+)
MCIRDSPCPHPHTPQSACIPVTCSPRPAFAHSRIGLAPTRSLRHLQLVHLSRALLFVLGRGLHAALQLELGLPHQLLELLQAALAVEHGLLQSSTSRFVLTRSLRSLLSHCPAATTAGQEGDGS